MTHFTKDFNLLLRESGSSIRQQNGTPKCKVIKVIKNWGPHSTKRQKSGIITGRKCCIGQILTSFRPQRLEQHFLLFWGRMAHSPFLNIYCDASEPFLWCSMQSLGGRVLLLFVFFALQQVKLYWGQILLHFYLLPLHQPVFPFSTYRATFHWEDLVKQQAEGGEWDKGKGEYAGQ